MRIYVGHMCGVGGDHFLYGISPAIWELCIGMVAEDPGRVAKLCILGEDGLDMAR